MKRNPLGKTGLHVSPLGFGAAEVGFLKTDQDRVATILNVLLDSGVNLIDTAANYAGSEELIGRAVGHRRAEYVLVSKCGAVIPGIPHAAWSKDLILATVDRSLKRLRTDRLDVVLLHSCDLPTLEKGQAMDALAEARDAGKVRFIGYSGDNQPADYAARRGADVLEMSINIADQANIVQGLARSTQENLGVLAKRPIANAAWRPLDRQPGFYSTYAKPYHDRLQKMLIRPSEFGFTDDSEGWAELALRFTLSQPGVSSAIIGTTNPDHARRNIAWADKGPLAVGILEGIKDAFRHAEAQSGEQWLGLT